MKIYKIKYTDIFYVECVMFGGEPFIQCKLTSDKYNAAWYEEDKAKIYCDELNKNLENVHPHFELEEIERNE